MGLDPDTKLPEQASTPDQQALEAEEVEDDDGMDVDVDDADMDDEKLTGHQSAVKKVSRDFSWVIISSKVSVMWYYNKDCIIASTPRKISQNRNFAV